MFLRKTLKCIMKNSQQAFRLFISKAQYLLLFRRCQQPYLYSGLQTNLLDITMTFDIRKFIGTGTAGSGAAKWSRYWRIDQYLEFSLFVIKKNSRKWRNDNRSQRYNSVNWPFTSKISLYSLLPKGWSIFVIDLKDCFFTKPL